MRRFNPEKELKKIQKGNKNKVIFGVITLLVVIAIGTTYALYQVRYSKRIIYTKVAPFSNKDIQLAVYVNGKYQDSFPAKTEDMLYGGYECEKDSKITFDKEKWSIILETNHPDKCSLRFGTKYEDESGANYPELYQGMIPVYFKDGKIYVADITNEWYNYDNNEWANAVLIDNNDPDKKAKFYDDNGNLLGGHEVSEEDILQMYVWIPRYKYQLWNVNNEGKSKQIINIEFEKDTENTGDIVCKYTNVGEGQINEDCTNKVTQEKVQNGEWYTHPAFTFKGTFEDTGTELKGMWVAKFRPSDPTDETGVVNSGKINELTILPNKTSKDLVGVKTIFDAIQSIETTEKYKLSKDNIDVHSMKNIEWGAVAYLTQSIYGIYKNNQKCGIDGMNFEECEVWMNNTCQGSKENGTSSAGSVTGCVGETKRSPVVFNTDISIPMKCDVNKQWNTGGVKASTTGNVYGIYDMSGGSLYYVMGTTLKIDGQSVFWGWSGYRSDEELDSKYYDLYSYALSGNTYERGHLGDGTREILEVTGNPSRMWGSTGVEFPFATSSADTIGVTWFQRGYSSNANGGAGLLFNGRHNGSGATNTSVSYVVITAQ